MAPYAVAVGAISSSQPSQKISTQQLQSSQITQNITSTVQGSRIEGGQFPSMLFIIIAIEATVQLRCGKICMTFGLCRKDHQRVFLITDQITLLEKFLSYHFGIKFLTVFSCSVWQTIEFRGDGTVVFKTAGNQI